MPNSIGGKKFKKGKKQKIQSEKKLIYKDPKEDQEYGKISTICGNGRFNIQCFDGKMRMGVLAGNMRKRMWVNKDDIVLISRWDFSTEGDKCSIVYKYEPDEVKQLEKENEFPSNIKLDSESDFMEYGETDDNISFTYDMPDDSEESEEEINLDEI
tara:strand:- start:390 stop:857 length:468 start_codon:yes stop_codon:yes gene_type:complete